MSSSHISYQMKRRIWDAHNEYQRENTFKKWKKLSAEETDQLAAYIMIFEDNDLDEHWEVNEYISDNDMWDEFDEIRALNTHGRGRQVKGIMPQYFALVCRVLAIRSDGGTPLEKSEHY